MSSTRPFSAYSTTPSSATTSLPRPVFASDRVAQKKAAAARSHTPTPVSTAVSPPLGSSATKTPSSPSSPLKTRKPSQHRSHMDLPSKLGDLPGLHLPEFHLPDLQRLKQQLNKHTPSFSLKSLQNSFQVPSYTSYMSSSSSSSPPSASSSPASSVSSTSNNSGKPRLSFTSRLSRSHSSNKLKSLSSSSSSSSEGAPRKLPPMTENNSTPPVTTTTQTVMEPPPASSPVSIPVHPSSYLIKKSIATTGAVATDTAAASTAAPKSLITHQSKAAGPSSSAPKSPVGHLFLQIIEARNLTLVYPAVVSRPYCLVEYDQGELITPPALAEGDTMDRRGRNDIFARAMAASSPKWRHDAEFDVVRPNQQISITIYDSGTEDDLEPAKRFLGQVKLSPSEVHNRMIDSWFRLQGREANEQVTGEIRVTIKYQTIESRHLSTDDFEILRVLGVGSFGKVYQVRKKDTERIYAMKVLDKKQVIEQKQVEHTIAERNVLIQALQSPFIVGLKFSFQTPTKLYLVQDFMNGGELFFHMQNEGTFSEPRARFYAAELVLALEHLHSCNVVYRDLKPENVLLNSQGHIVLVDFGLCKQNVTEDERTHTFCGTTEYLAPEIIKGTGYGKAVDWWSLGVLIYEMLFGTSPFEDTRTEGVHHKILHQPIIFPKRPSSFGLRRNLSPVKHHDYSTTEDGQETTTTTTTTCISQNAQDLIQKLLDKNPKTRLGSGPNGAEAVAAIKAHPFFQGIDFGRLATRDVTPPFQPHIGITGDLDVSNFDPQFTDQTTNRKDIGNGVGINGSYFAGSGSLNAAAADGEADSFLVQQQQRAANLYRQKQMRGESVAWSPHGLSRGRRSSNSWSSYRTLSNDSLFSFTSEANGPMQARSGAGAGAGAGAGGGGLSRPTTAYKTRALIQQQQQAQLQQRHQEYFKGFTFEGESILESIQKQDDEQQSGGGGGVSGMFQDEDEDGGGFLGRTSRSAAAAAAAVQGLASLQGAYKPNQLFSGEAGSIDSIFGSM